MALERWITLVRIAKKHLSSWRGVNLSTREIATILAALRLWQTYPDESLADDFMDIATDCDRFDRLDEDEIDRLCEDLEHDMEED